MEIYSVVQKSIGNSQKRLTLIVS